MTRKTLARMYLYEVGRDESGVPESINMVYQKGILDVQMKFSPKSQALLWSGNYSPPRWVYLPWPIPFVLERGDSKLSESHKRDMLSDRYSFYGYQNNRL